MSSDAFSTQSLDALHEFVGRGQRLFVITGAGCSTDSGIPDYRDGEGDWKRPPPMTFQQFMGGVVARQRYWARSMVGWRLFSAGRPNGAHRALRQMEAQGHIELLVTQNVDGLHRRAEQEHLLELHGCLDEVVCMACGRKQPRAQFQRLLLADNPEWSNLAAVMGPDGDVDLEMDFSAFVIPACPHCGGILKPDVVFFGETVPRERVQAAYDALARADGVLVVGSSLMVYSGFRFVRDAATAGKPIAIVNRGRTRADPLAALKLEAGCAEVLEALLARLPEPGQPCEPAGAGRDQTSVLAQSESRPIVAKNAIT